MLRGILAQGPEAIRANIIGWGFLASHFCPGLDALENTPRLGAAPDPVRRGPGPEGEGAQEKAGLGERQPERIQSPQNQPLLITISTFAPGYISL